MIRFAVLGYGFIGTVHAAVLRKMEEVELVGVMEPDKSKWRRATEGNLSVEGAEQPVDAPFFKSWEQLLESRTVDAVAVCLPTHLHRAATVRALEAGLHVVCEKPMALSLEDCDAMIAAARAVDRRLFIAQCIRFWPEYELLADFVRRGELGPLMTLRLQRLSGMPSWGGPSPWFFDESRSGGCLFDLHVHDLDFIQSLLGKPRAVFAQGATAAGVNAAVLAQYDYGNGLVCSAEASWLCRSGFRMGYSAVFEKGQLDYDSAASPSIRLFSEKADEPQTPQTAPGDGYERQYRYFIRCLLSGEPLLRMEPESARLSIEIALAEKRSLSERRVISLQA